MRDTLNDQRNRIIGFPGAVLWHDFLFLIPAETIQQMVKGIGLTPRTNDPFMAGWEQAVAAYFRGDYGRALDRLEGADRLLPGLGDVQRLRFLLKDLLEFRRELTPARSSQ